MFRPPERRCQTTPLHAFEYQRVVSTIFTHKIYPKITIFHTFPILRVLRETTYPPLEKPKNANVTKRTIPDKPTP